ncbi:DUF885 family protein [Phenylobacterium sp. J367]|uniref:DUF885 domain-containing protein n=1 Tax=Phenylobacterium sp. J367 TaxID=2898435 RepID=UPI002150F638|nr:DUF885 family protein [Phenylobacterium sp. J367]MCR5877993.1 DUF885 family protein [Phenylobacterium sp. J367]
MRHLILAAALALAAAPALPQPAWADDDAVRKLVADYEAWWLGDDPVTAGNLGVRAALSKLADVTPAADARRKAALTAFQARARAIPDAGLSETAKLNRDLLAWTLESRLGYLGFDQARIQISSDGSFFDTLGYLAASTPIRTADDARAWADRLEAGAKDWRDNTENTRRGVKTRFTQPRSTVEAVIRQVGGMVAVPVDQDPLLRPLAKLPEAMGSADRAAVRARAVRAVEAIRVEQRAFLKFLETEYLPAARPGLGVRSAPGGEAYYRFVVRDHTTTNMTPEQIHALGVSEVARIRAEMDVAMKEAGWTGDLAGFIATLRKDPKFYATSREDLLEKASEIAKRLDDKLPGYFGTLPRLPYGVRPVPKELEQGYTTGRYWGGSPTNGVAGGYMVNTYALDQRGLHELPALTAHEAVPGHHLQIALAQEMPETPAFRRESYYTAFGEGWGLYSERLAGEMGIYRTPYERFGQLSYEMWRACRLVADTGIHWMGWSLDQARACFTDNTALSPLNIEVELARYVSWPGQALAYKIGERKYVELRGKAKTALGDKFDIRRFHDAVLLAGPLPMDILEARIGAWIVAEQNR